MELNLYAKEYNTTDTTQHFMGFYYSLQRKYLASHLLKKRLSLEQRSEVVTMVIKR